MALVEKFVHHRNGELVLGRLGVEGAVVDVEALRLVRFTDEEHGRRERRSARPDDALGEHGFALPFQLILLQLGVAVRAHGDWNCVWQEVDVVVVRAGRWKTPRLLEDGAVLLQEAIQQGLLGAGGDGRHVLLWRG
jgi:hypothetical protein